MIFLSVLQNGKEKRFIIFPGGKNMKAEIIRQLNVFKERGMKPNYSALAGELARFPYAYFLKKL